MSLKFYVLAFESLSGLKVSQKSLVKSFLLSTSNARASELDEHIFLLVWEVVFSMPKS